MSPDQIADLVLRTRIAMQQWHPKRPISFSDTDFDRIKARIRQRAKIRARYRDKVAQRKAANP